MNGRIVKLNVLSNGPMKRRTTNIRAVPSEPIALVKAMESGGTIENLESSRVSYSGSNKIGWKRLVCEWLAPRFG
ncbi:hypothetical protein CSIM01_00420 [Colletotrichum simmondsii]|uniref:Uncharacterized protein n=1 Tax=Colletotrichum simmondsii TaxID=703756 RepID=A0A135SF20_9PEZI|nr:hypothetical protein CSIM01_00420 [Colletotrichum simmondsii]